MVSYLWSTGDTTSSIIYYNALSATDILTLTVTHNSGNVIEDSVVVINSGTFDINFDIIDDSCGYGSIDLYISRGISPYSFQWNNGAETQNLISVTSGYYLVYITDSINCFASEIINYQSSAPL